jgi:N-acetylglucosaminyldiphosphoundecaprenol N-acetyl-beta-D-mannosaminyltransferase
LPILGVGVTPTSYGEVLRQCRAWIEEKRQAGRYICVVSVHGIMTAYKDARCRQVINQADLATPDGMPVVWALRSFGANRQRRVYGPNLMLALCGQAMRLGHRVFLYGGTEDTLARLEHRLRQRFPGLILAGRYSPPFRPLTEEEDAEVTRKIQEARADLLLVGISTPKQDFWMRDHRTKLPGVVMAGVGAAFNFHAGEVKQAPAWMQSRGLEWLYRLAMEPVRLWKRYLLVTPLFLPLWALQRLGIVRFEDR